MRRLFLGEQVAGCGPSTYPRIAIAGDPGRRSRQHLHYCEVLALPYDVVKLWILMVSADDELPSIYPGQLVSRQGQSHD